MDPHRKVVKTKLESSTTPLLKKKGKHFHFIFSLQLILKYTKFSKDIHQETALKHSSDFLIIPKHLKIKLKLIIIATNY